MKIRSLQIRIAALFLFLIFLVQAGGLLLTNQIGENAAHKSIGEELVAGARIFDRLLEQDTQRLVQGARLLSSDYAFREAIATGDSDTIESALSNHGKRIDADLMMLIGLDQRVIADTLDLSTGKPFMFPKMLATAEASSEASSMVLVRGKLYQLVIVPVLAPLPIAHVAVGFNVNDALAKDLQRLTRLDVSFLSRQGSGNWQLQASTLGAQKRAELLGDVGAERFAESDAGGNAVYRSASVTRVLPLPSRSDQNVIALLQEPVSAALEPFRRLEIQLALISLLAVVVSFLLSFLIAKRIARPVRQLADVARRIAAGDYSMKPPLSTSDEIGELATAVRTMQDDIASRESRIMDLAYRDTLTGLPNRTLYGDRLAQMLGAAARTGKPVAVLLLDLDHFKDVNDTLGHPIGDLLLREAAARLTAVVEPRTGTVARLGGDEFAILLPDHGVGDAQRVAATILRALEAPMPLEGHIVDVRGSVGIAVAPEHGSETATLLRRADMAMYAAKRNHVGIVVWDDRYDRMSSDRLSLMSDLRKAVDHNELMLVYQPKVTLAGGDQHHVEALVRWQHPERGLLPPSEFIPFAEQTGYIRSITQWVLAHAIDQCASWRAGGLAMNVAINISARDLMDTALPDKFSALLDRYGCAARWIQLEITESAILDDPGHAIENLRRLHALGCRFAIDDYGTGYSSLAYLRRLPLHELKIDKSFVMAMARDASDAVIVRSTIELAHNMGLAVVAEGVEDEVTLERLRAMGCDMVQGYLLCRPISAAEIAAQIHQSPWTHATREVSGLRRVV